MPGSAADHPTSQPSNMVQQKEKKIANGPPPSWWKCLLKGKASQHMVPGSEKVSSCRAKGHFGFLSQDQLGSLCGLWHNNLACFITPAGSLKFFFFSPLILGHS